MITLFNFISFIAIGKFKCAHYLDVKNCCLHWAWFM